MQDFTQDMCNNLTQEQQYILRDTRDGKFYTAARLKDGKCWMTQNLALELSTSKTLTNQDTDLNSVTNWTPERNTIPTGSLSVSTWTNDNNNPYSYNSGRTDYGVYYNWTAAIASNDSSSLTAQYQNAPNSVCPKGWRLPMVYNGSSSNFPNEFGKMLYAEGIIMSPSFDINIYYDLSANSYNLLKNYWLSAGNIRITTNPDDIFEKDTYGYYYSSTIPYVYFGFFNNQSQRGFSVRGGNESASWGFSVRCVLR